MERGLMSAGGGVRVLARAREVIRREAFDVTRLVTLVEREGDGVLTAHQAAKALAVYPSEIRRAASTWRSPVILVRGRLERVRAGKVTP